MVTGGGRSKEGDDGGASGRAELVSDRWGKEEGGDDDRAHNQINIWALLWRTVRRSLADRPQFPGCYTYFVIFFLSVLLLSFAHVTGMDLVYFARRMHIVCSNDLPFCRVQFQLDCPCNFFFRFPPHIIINY